MSARKLHSSNHGWLFWMVCLIAAVSLLSNAYLFTLSTDRSVARPVFTPTAGVNEDLNNVHTSPIAGPSISELQTQLLSVAEGVARNNEQLELLVSELSTGDSQEILARRAEKREAAKQARIARNQRMRDRQFLHLEENERAIALHELWMKENGAALKLTEAQVLEVERSGIEALERYNARNGISQD